MSPAPLAPAEAPPTGYAAPSCLACHTDASVRPVTASPRHDGAVVYSCRGCGGPAWSPMKAAPVYRARVRPAAAVYPLPIR